MRWNEKEKDEKHYPSNGDTKIAKKFALFPIKINKECRWLEYVHYEIRFNLFDKDRNVGIWEKDRFLTDREVYLMKKVN